MELSASKSSFKKESKMLNYSLFSDTISKYAQATGATTPEGDKNLDPNTLQVGQQVFDQDGTAHNVIQNENGTITTVPADQAGQQLPQGVKNLKPEELQDYSNTPPQQNVQAKRVAQEELGIDWEELESMALEVATFAQAQKEKAFFAALDQLNTAALSYIQFPADVSSKDITGKKAQEAPQFLRIVEQALLSSFSEALDEIETEAGYQEPGFMETAIQALLDGVQTNLVMQNISNLEALAKEKFDSFISQLSNIAIDDEDTQLDPQTQKLLEHYSSYFS